ncbi:MAG TPA: MFS transporter, partial [Thermoplasmata archaeon]|nr:MFS transporter [Thermoplasmata archaeon]
PFWLAASGVSAGAAMTLAGMVFVAGALGCVLAGGWSRRVGEARAARAALAISGICCALSPWLFAAPVWLLAPFIVLWGGAAVADSGMFSSISARAAPRDYVGTALTTQNSIGFAITIVSISLLPVFAGWTGSWQFAMLLLAPGPLLALIPITGLIRKSQ